MRYEAGGTLLRSARLPARNTKALPGRKNPLGEQA